MVLPGKRWLCVLSQVNHRAGRGTLLPLLFGFGTGFPFALPWSVPGSLTYQPLPSALLEGGFVVGLCQWAALRFVFERPTPAMRLLWICGVWLGIGLGPFTGGAATRLVFRGASEAAQPALLGLGWGATIGLVSAAVLWILLRERRNARASE